MRSTALLTAPWRIRSADTPDLAARRVRFIGNARERIREDYLRILRFFRFFASYDPASSPDAEGLDAAIAEKAGLAQLSGERIRAELLLLLAAPRAVEAARTLQEAGLIAPLIGVAGDVDRLARLVADRDVGRPRARCGAAARRLGGRRRA